METDYGRLFSVYRSQEGEAFWVFTEDDRSLIVILFPEEYEGYLEFIRKHTKTVAAVQ